MRTCHLGNAASSWAMTSRVPSVLPSSMTTISQEAAMDCPDLASVEQRIFNPSRSLSIGMMMEISGTAPEELLGSPPAGAGAEVLESIRFNTLSARRAARWLLHRQGRVELKLGLDPSDVWSAVTCHRY